MCDEYRGVIDAALSTKQFVAADFLQQQKQSLADESDVHEILRIYTNQLRGADDRRKVNSRRAATIESLLSLSGQRKVHECKVDIRMAVERIDKERARQTDPPLPSQQCYEVPTEPWRLIETMQAWGDHEQGDARYYLHMVFRYQMRVLHKGWVEKGVVLTHPSLQCIVDHLYPSPCHNTFPPEFRRFMDDCAGRAVKVSSLPVPKKGSGKDVDYTTNFETEPAVTALRIKLQRTIPSWGYKDVYPEYLHCGGRGNDEISAAIVACARAREASGRRRDLNGNTLETVEKVVSAVPALSRVARAYAFCRYRTGGERLRERLGFFLRPTIRSIFLTVKSKGLVGDVFEATEASYDQFRNFDLFCTADSPLDFLDRESGEHESRTLLLLLENVTALFRTTEGGEDTDPSQIMRDAITRIENLTTKS